VVVVFEMAITARRSRTRQQNRGNRTREVLWWLLVLVATAVGVMAGQVVILLVAGDS